MIIEIAAGVALGALGAAGHLAVVRVRASRIVLGGLAPPWPVGLLAPVVAVLLAVRIGREAAWAVPVGLFLGRLALLARLERRAKT